MGALANTTSLSDRIREAIKRNLAERISKKTGEAYQLEYMFAAPDRKWRSDIAWPNVKVALEIDGGTWTMGRHNRPGAVLKEMEKGNGYAERLWLDFHSPWEWVESGEIEDPIVAAITRRQEESH